MIFNLENKDVGTILLHTLAKWRIFFSAAIYQVPLGIWKQMIAEIVSFSKSEHDPELWQVTFSVYEISVCLQLRLNERHDYYYYYDYLSTSLFQPSHLYVLLTYIQVPKTAATYRM